MCQFMDDRRGRTPNAHAQRVPSDDEILRPKCRVRPAPMAGDILLVVVDPDRAVVEEVAKGPAARQGSEFVVSLLVVSHPRQQDCERPSDGGKKLVGNKGSEERVCVTVGAITDTDHGDPPSSSRMQANSPTGPVLPGNTPSTTHTGGVTWVPLGCTDDGA